MRAVAGELGRGLLEVLFPPVCAACGALGQEPFCPLCFEATEPAPPFAIAGAAAARAIFAYGGPVALAVRALKYEGHPEHGRALGEVMRRGLSELGTLEVAVPMPLARARLLHRRYNQARELARGLGLPVEAGALCRLDDTPQVGQGRAARLASPSAAFVPGARSVRGRSVLLVDDVVTTGATAIAATRALLEAGAGRVAVLALARTE